MAPMYRGQFLCHFHFLLYRFALSNAEFFVCTWHCQDGPLLIMVQSTRTTGEPVALLLQGALASDTFGPLAKKMRIPMWKDVRFFCPDGAVQLLYRCCTAGYAQPKGPNVVKHSDSRALVE
jgi:hypothetical protein